MISWRNYPLLRADGNSLDYPETKYFTDAETMEGEVTIENRISGKVAETFSRWLDREAACWVTEIRCPSMLFSQSFTTQASRDSFNWDNSNSSGAGTCFVVTSLSATRRVTIDSELLHPVWRSANRLSIPAGAVLAVGKTFRTKPMLDSILSFSEDKYLPNGGMRLTGPDEFIKFEVFVSSDLWATLRQQRNLWVSALIAALGRLNKEEHLPDDNLVLFDIQQTLHKANVADWLSDDWDPAEAGSFLGRFTPLITADQT